MEHEKFQPKYTTQGRAKRPKKWPAHMSIWVTEADYDLIQGAADNVGMSKASFMLSAIKYAIKNIP